MKKYIPVLILSTAAMLILTACSPQTPEPTVEAQTPSVQSLIAEGRLMPANVVDHAFTVPGRTAEVLVEDGSQVTAGQVLVRLEVPQDAHTALARAQQELLAAQLALDVLTETADIHQAQARLAFLDAQEQLEQAQTDFEADESDDNQARLDLAQAALVLAENDLKKLENSQGIDPDQLALAQTRLDSATAAEKSAQALIDAYTLIAVMDGTVTGFSLEAGEQVSAGIPLLTIADFSSWAVKTDNLSEIEVPEVSIDQQVEVVLDALPEVILAGEVTHINSRFEEKRGDITYTVTINLTQTDPRMRWGMTAAVRFVQ